ncbi:MAG: hypothetical protein Q9167_001617 [Letrouitia subvulpina]
MSHPIPPPPAPGPSRTVTVPVKPKQPHVPQPPHRSHHLRDRSVPQSAVLPSSSNPFSSTNISSPFSDLLSPITKSVTKHDTPLDVLKNREDEAKDAEANAKEESERQQKISFSHTAQQMEREIRGQVQTFNCMTFEAQRERAELLEGRMKGARKRVEMLNGRMEHVRNKIEDFEQKEKNARRRVKFTVRCVWGLLGMLTTVLALIFIAKHWPHVRSSLDGVDMGSVGHASLDVKPLPETSEPMQSGSEAEPPGESLYVPIGWENGLRMLDEL